MPRTKAARKKAKSSPFADLTFPNVEVLRGQIMSEVNIILKDEQVYIERQLQTFLLSVPSVVANMTAAELRELPPNWNGSYQSSVILDSTRETGRQKDRSVVKHTLRSSSCGDDGYLTAESSKGASGDRLSRIRKKLEPSKKRLSRSLSRNQKANTTGRYRTPVMRQQAPKTYGTITPKANPKMPHVVLRRPNPGEVAVSMQGSPLLTGNVTADSAANVNIPLQDGNVLCLQPRRGLRMSQLPELDKQTMQQLRALRDNLDRVCAMQGHR